MTRREQTAVGAGVSGLVLAVAAGYGWGGWPAACAVAAVLLIGVCFLLGTGDTVPPVEDGPLEAEQPEEEWQLVELRGDDDAGQASHLTVPGTHGPPRFSSPNWGGSR